MSSATSIDPSTGPAGKTAGQPAASRDNALSPWQFFLLAGMLCATGVVIVATGQSPASIILLSLTVIAASFVALGAYRALAPLVAPEGDVAPSAIGRPAAGRSRAREDAGPALDQGARVRLRDGEDRAGRFRPT